MGKSKMSPRKGSYIMMKFSTGNNINKDHGTFWRRPILSVLLPHIRWVTVMGYLQFNSSALENYLLNVAGKESDY